MHSKLTGFADIELEVIVIAGCDEALSALCTPSSLSVKTASFSLEIIHLNHTCQHSDNILCAKILERLLHIHYNRTSLDRHGCALQLDCYSEAHNQKEAIPVFSCPNQVLLSSSASL